MADYARDALKAAADSFAQTMRKVAAMRTRTTADAVNVAMDGDEAVVQAGHEGGAWGWDPIVAAMFDNNLRHPLFGNKNKWYKQGRFPITGYTEKAGINSATDAFVRAGVDPLIRDHGFTE